MLVTASILDGAAKGFLHKVSYISMIKSKYVMMSKKLSYYKKSKIRDDVMTSKTSHDIKKFVITSKIRNNEKNDKNLVKKLVMRSKSVSGCQQNASCCENVPDVKMIVMTPISVTSKIRHYMS